MNKYISIIAGIGVAALALTSCSDDFLEVTNPTGEPLEEYYNSDEHLNEALTSAYAPLHWPDWDGVAYNDLTIDAEIMGDDFWVGGANISDNQHWHKLFNFEGDGNNTLSTLWGDFYSGIKRCNDVIKYCSWGGGTEASRKSFEMQARLLRVYYYNILWHYYGNVPFYLENLSEPYTAPQLTADEIYNKLLPELEEIIASNVLPMRWAAAESGRVSQAMAYMLYAEMVMYQNDQSRYAQALDYMKQIINDSEILTSPTCGPKLENGARSRFSKSTTMTTMRSATGPLLPILILRSMPVAQCSQHSAHPMAGVVAKAGTVATMAGASSPCALKPITCMPKTTSVVM